MAEENKINGLAWFVAGLGVGALVGFSTLQGRRETREDLANGAREEPSSCATAPQAASSQRVVEKSKEQVASMWTAGARL